MNKSLTCCLLIGLLLPLVSYLPAQSPAPSAKEKTADKKGPETTALEKKLIGTFYGPACGGDYTFKSDGTYSVENFTPGNNHLTGTWSVKWDALPPTLILHCKTSDFLKNGSSRTEYEYLNKPVELKLVELNDKKFAIRGAGADYEFHYTRNRDEGGYSKKVGRTGE